MFKLFIFVCFLAFAAAKPAYVAAPFAYSAYSAPAAYSAGYAPVAYSSPYVGGYSAYSGYPYAYSAYSYY